MTDDYYTLYVSLMCTDIVTFSTRCSNNICRNVKMSSKTQYNARTRNTKQRRRQKRTPTVPNQSWQQTHSIPSINPAYQGTNVLTFVSSVIVQTFTIAHLFPIHTYREVKCVRSIQRISVHNNTNYRRNIFVQNRIENCTLSTPKSRSVGFFVIEIVISVTQKSNSEMQ